MQSLRGGDAPDAAESDGGTVSLATSLDIEALEKAIKEHDWSHEMSDDHSVWLRGQRSLGEVVRLLRAVPEYEARRLWAMHAPASVPYSGSVSAALEDWRNS